MGWTSTYAPEKPGTDELNRIADRELQGEHIKILDRSAWLNWNSHRYSLVEITEPGKERLLCIAVTVVEYRDNQVCWKTMDDSMGPYMYDCPTRLVKKANKTPTRNETAAKWRAKVLAEADKKSRTDKLLREMRDNFPAGDRRLILVRYTGERDENMNPITIKFPVNYHAAQKRGKPIHAYSDPAKPAPHLWKLRRGDIDLEETEKLRALPL